MAAVLSSATSSTRCRVGNRPAISTDTRTSSQIRVTFSAFRDIDALDRRDDAEGKGRGRCPTRSEHRGHRAYRSTRASERGQAKPSWKILGCDAARQAPSEGLTSSQTPGAVDRHGCLFHPCAMWSPMHACCCDQGFSGRAGQIVVSSVRGFSITTSRAQPARRAARTTSLT